MLSNEIKDSDSFEEMLNEVKGKYLDYSVKVTNEKRIVKSLSLKYKQLHMKAEYLIKICEESQKLLKSRLEVLKSERLTEIPEVQITKLYSSFGLIQQHPGLSYFLQALEQFDPDLIPEQVVNYKASESHPIQEGTPTAIDEFLNLCVDCRMKYDLLKVYKAEMRRTLSNIEARKENIHNLEEKIKEFLQYFVEKEEDDWLETKEEPEEIVLDSDELYGQIWLAGESSTIIFEHPGRCSTCCILL